MRFENRENIVQIIIEMITACWFDGHLKIVSVIEFIGIIDLDIK